MLDKFKSGIPFLFPDEFSTKKMCSVHPFPEVTSPSFQLRSGSGVVSGYGTLFVGSGLSLSGHHPGFLSGSGVNYNPKS